MTKKRTATKPKTRRVAAKKTATKAPARRSTPSKPAARKRRPKINREVLGPKIVALREKDKTWRFIAEKLGIDLPTAVLAYEYAVLDPADQITGTRKQVAKQIVTAYDKKNLSWQKIQARTGLSFVTVKKLYEEASGKDASQGHAKAAERARKRPVRRVAAKAKAQAKSKPVTKAKSKPTTQEKPSSAKTQRATARKNRKTKTGSVNPSKG